MRRVNRVNLLWLLVFTGPGAAKNDASELSLYSINTGSFVYHMTGNVGDYNEIFKNKFFSVERKFSQESKNSMLVGTMKNSFNDRCLSVGMRRDLHEINSSWMIKGVYAYTGEFFAKAFSDCGNHGSYHDFKKVTGIGFSPYIYHALQYNPTTFFGVEAGIIAPDIFATSIQWSFR